MGVKIVSEIKDIYSGEYAQLWEDEGYTYVSIFLNGITLSFPTEVAKEVLKELSIAIETFKNSDSYKLTPPPYLGQIVGGAEEETPFSEN